MKEQLLVLPPAQPPSSGIIYRLLFDKRLLSYPHSYYYIAMFKIIFFIINTIIIGKKHLVRFKINEELDIFNQLKRRMNFFMCIQFTDTLNNFGDTLIIVFLKGENIEMAPL